MCILLCFVCCCCLYIQFINAVLLICPLLRSYSQKNDDKTTTIVHDTNPKYFSLNKNRNERIFVHTVCVASACAYVVHFHSYVASHATHTGTKQKM